MADSNISFHPPAVVEPQRLRIASPIAKAVRSYFLGSPIEPRKGNLTTGTPRVLPRGSVNNLQPTPPRFTAPGYSIEELAARDDIIFAIRNTLRRAVGEMKWKLVPDTEKLKAELKRWATVVQLNLAYPRFELKFVPQVIDVEFFWRARDELNNVVNSMTAAGEDPATSPQLRAFFAGCLEYHDTIAESHINFAQRLFERPNPSAESSFRAFLDTVIDYLTLYDQAPVIKNPNFRGQLAEIYTIPGDQVRVYRCDDLSTPQPPEIAYDWYQDGTVRANYNNAELIFMRMNPSQSGYGTSPIFVVLRKMIGSMYGDQYINDGFSNSNVPNFVFDLGPDVSQDERDMIEAEWENKVAKGQRRGIFIGSKEGVKGFIPLTTGSNKDNLVLDLLKYWANVKCAAYGLSLNDIGFTEDLHRTTSETQAELTQSRGVNSMATTIEGFINGEIMRGQMWVRDNPMDPNSLAGHLVPCFPFRDVKFEFVRDEKETRLEDAQRAESLVGIGVLTRNEMRKELKLPPMPGGDVLTVDTQPGCKVEDLVNLPQPQAPQAPGEGGPPGEGGEGDEGGGDAGANAGAKPPKPPAPPKPPQPGLPKGASNGAAQKMLGDLNRDLVKFLES